MNRWMLAVATVGITLLGANSADAQIFGRLRGGGGQDAGLGYEVAPNSGGQVLRLKDRLQNLLTHDPNTGQPFLRNGRGFPIVDFIGGIATRAEDSSRLQQLLDRGERPIFGGGRLRGSESGIGSGNGPIAKMMEAFRERLGNREGSERLLDRIREGLTSGDGSRIAAALQLAVTITNGLVNSNAFGPTGPGRSLGRGDVEEAKRIYNLRKQN